MRRKSRWLCCLVAFIFLILAACQSPPPEKNKRNQTPYADQQSLLGTYVQIRIYDQGKEAVLEKAFARVKALQNKLTVNEEGSEIDLVNQYAGIKPIQVSDDVYQLAKQAYAFSEAAQGGFDMTIGPITQLWHIGFEDARKPTQAEIEQALALVDYRKVMLDDQKQTIYLAEKGMQLDLGAIAKGFITDQVVALLKKEGVTTAIIDLGGNVYVLGQSPRAENTDWQVGIQDPNQARNTIVGSLPASNQTLVTSGIYERYLKVDGQTYHHLFDPKSGYPFDNDLAGVTIVTKHSVDADGLSTAVFSLGTKKGLAYVENLKDVDAIFVTKANQVYVSQGIQADFQLDENSGYTLGQRQDLK